LVFRRIQGNDFIAGSELGPGLTGPIKPEKIINLSVYKMKRIFQLCPNAGVAAQVYAEPGTLV
jgi:hypothetical protein